MLFFFGQFNESCSSKYCLPCFRKARKSYKFGKRHYDMQNFPESSCVTNQTETRITVKIRKKNLKQIQTGRVLKSTSFKTYVLYYYTHSEATETEEDGCRPHGNTSPHPPEHSGPNSDVRRWEWPMEINSWKVKRNMRAMGADQSKTS